MPDMRTQFYDTMVDLLGSDPRIAMVMADIGVGSMEERTVAYSERVVNVGIREQAMIGVTAGFALEGFRPIAHTYAPFLVERAFEQVKLDFRHQGVGGILVSVGASHDWPEGGRTHQAPADVALMSTLEGWTVHVPGHADEVDVLLRKAAAGEDCVYIRLSSRSNSEARADASGSLVAARTGSASAPVVVAVGPMLDPTLAATRDLDATILYSATVRPFDELGLRAVVGGSEVILVEPYLVGTSTEMVTRAFHDIPLRVLSIGVGAGELRRYGTPEQHDAAWGLDETGLRSQIRAFLDPAQS